MQTLLARKPHRRSSWLCLWGLLLLLAAWPALSSAQVVRPSMGGTMTRSGSGTSNTSRGSNRISSSSVRDTSSTGAYTDTSSTKGLIFHEETPDSVLRQKVFLFYHRRARIWIDQWWNPTLDPTGVQHYDAADAFNGNYYLGKGMIGHPHMGLFLHQGESLHLRLQPDAFAAYSLNPQNVRFFQTLTPFSTLGYGGSLASEHTLHVSHTQNIRPGWNVAFDYRLLNPEGIYASQGALDHLLYANTNYFSPDSRLQAKGALIWQKFRIDENGGLAADSIFTERLQSNRAGIPVKTSGAGSRTNRLSSLMAASYSLERQSIKLRYRDSLVVRQVNDSVSRLDTIVVVDTIPLRSPRMVNRGVVGVEINTEREKRVYSDSTLWGMQEATLYWTNDAYASYRWSNPLRLTFGVQPRRMRAIIGNDTLQCLSLFDPFARVELSIGKMTIGGEAEWRDNYAATNAPDARYAASLTFPFDSARTTLFSLRFAQQEQLPDVRMVHDASVNQAVDLKQISTQRIDLSLRHQELLDLHLAATHASHAAWYDTALLVHEGTADYWLLQASITARLQWGAAHLDMQQLLQYSTDALQAPVPLWASKNSIYAEFALFRGLLRLQTGIDLRFHTPYFASYYHPATGLFLQQEEEKVGGYLWGDVFVALQVKRASIYLKAGHVNALWENPATYFSLPHYPGQGFGLQWGVVWCFFD